jgi:hypothetical protein
MTTTLAIINIILHRKLGTNKFGYSFRLVLSLLLRGLVWVSKELT